MTNSEHIYGRNAVRESLRAKRRTFKRLLIADSVRDAALIAELQNLAQQHHIPIVRPAKTELDRRTNGANHQGVLLETGPFPYAELDAIFAADTAPLILVLDHLQDPQNLGTLIRTADVVGVHGIIIPDRRAAAITPAVVNASAGAVEHLNIVSVTNLARTLDDLKERGVWVAGLEDDPQAQEYDRVDLSGPLALVIGAEGPGLARLTRERCDYLVRLPMQGHVASLNAATAGSIALYHIWRSRSRS